MSYQINGIVSSPPPGSIIAYLGIADPSGWVICDGIQRTDGSDGKYNNLINAGIGTGTLNGNYTPPDLRALFLRATGTNATSGLTTYSGPTIKTSQTDDIKSHTHSLSSSFVVYGTAQGGGSADVMSWNTTVSSTGATPAATSKETRPVNYGVNWIL